MPNHVTNVLVASPEVVHAITRHHTDEEKTQMRREGAERAAHYEGRTGKPWPYFEHDAAKLEERFVDFELLIPIPDTVSQESCSHGHLVQPDPYAETCWLPWSRNHWGTKWNGYSTNIEPQPGDLCKLRFDTAWTHPGPIVAAIMARFPGEDIDVEWADEDLGHNLGRYRIEKGEIVLWAEPEPGSDEAREMAAQVKYGKTYAELLAEDEDDE